MRPGRLWRPAAVLSAALCSGACTSIRSGGLTAPAEADAGTPDGDRQADSGEGLDAEGGPDSAPYGADLNCGPESPPDAGSPPAEGPEGPSCEGGLRCAGQSCCQSALVAGGTFPMGRSQFGPNAVPGLEFSHVYGAEIPQHCARVGAFYLDRFEVTAGRMLRFVRQYDAFRAAGLPREGDGASPALRSTPQMDAGWRASFAEHLPNTALELKAELRCAPGDPTRTWPDAGEPQGDQLVLPIGCLRWATAFAFCVWDGGRLPTEAEWEFAAAGGAEERLYPWGGQPPDCGLANFDGCSNTSALFPVGSTTGDGRFGHHDLAGNVLEWVLDSYQPYSAGLPADALVCDDCVVRNDATDRIVRGGGSLDAALLLRSAWRSSVSGALLGGGARCVHDLR